MIVLLLEFSPDEQHAGVVSMPAAADKGYEEAEAEESANCCADYALLVAVAETEGLVVGYLQLVAGQIAVPGLDYSY